MDAPPFLATAQFENKSAHLFGGLVSRKSQKINYVSVSHNLPYYDILVSISR
jgi:hypothetical protein